MCCVCYAFANEVNLPYCCLPLPNPPPPAPRLLVGGLPLLLLLLLLMLGLLFFHELLHLNPVLANLLLLHQPELQPLAFLSADNPRIPDYPPLHVHSREQALQKLDVGRDVPALELFQLFLPLADPHDSEAADGGGVLNVGVNDDVGEALRGQPFGVADSSFLLGWG